MNRHLCLKVLMALCFLFGFADATTQSRFEWHKLTQLPGNPELMEQEDVDDQPGLAGSYSGISGQKLIVAGGANFPYGPPWEGGEKIFWDHIYVLDLEGGGDPEWVESGTTLPVRMGYGGVIQMADELILIGGENGDGIVSEVLGLRWNPETSNVEIRELPSLPDGFQANSAGFANGQILVHGTGQNGNELWRLDPTGGWIELPGCPGPPRLFPVSAVQKNGRVEGFYLFSGRTRDEQGVYSLLGDGYMYDPVLQTWNYLGPVGNTSHPGKIIMGAATIPSGSSHVLILGGDDGRELLDRIDLITAIEQAANQSQRDLLNAKLDSAFIHHDGFSREILAYHTITNSWMVLDTFPEGLPVTTHAIAYNDQVYLTSGEIHPGVRTPWVWKGTKSSIRSGFGWVNYTVIGIYFLILVLVGVKYSKRQKSTADYFTGGGRIPWWAAGLSLFGTSLSAITFMAIPAKTYMTDWGYFFFQMTPLITAPILIALYIPYFRGLNITSAYEYLENRFNLLTRLLGSLSFMVLQLGRVGIVLFLPSIAVNLVTGIDIHACIIAMGVVSIIYTMMGGIEAVIWTDVLQVIILMGGAFLALFWMFGQVDLSVPQAYDQLVVDQKFQILDTAFDFRRPTIWVVILGGIFANLITSGSDQTMVQRYLTTATTEEANRSVWTFALLAIPATLIFFTVGSTLYLFYQEYPQHLDVTLANDDAIFPWYIVTQLPTGVSGLLIAGIFSAAMSTLSSSMNSVSTAFITDFYHRFSWGSVTSELGMARISTLTFGVIGTGFALLMASMNIQSLWDQFQLYVGLFAGGLGGLFLLGMTTKRAHGRGAVVGLILSGIIQYYLTNYTHMHVLLFSATGFVSCYVLSYIFSLIIPNRKTA